MRPEEKFNWPLTILLILGLITVLFPLYMTIVIAFKQPSEMTNSISGILSLPQHWSLANFREAMEVTDFWRSLLNSVLITGITMGLALKEALGDKRGIRRYGTFYLPMDEALAFVSLDISGRPFLVYDGGEMAPTIGGYDTELTEEFLRALAVNAGLTLHVKVLYGTNSHHKVEAIFKALGHALREAVSIDPRVQGVPSTKGSL